MPKGDYKSGEAADPGRAICIRHTRPLMTEEDIGEFVAIDVDTGAYEVDTQVSEALFRLKVHHPDNALTAQHVGYRTPFGFVPRRPDILGGTVNLRLGPVVSVELIASDRQTHPVEVVLESRFDGSLCLPGDFIRRLEFT